MKKGALFVKKNNVSADSSETRTASPAIDDVQANWQRVVRRRSFLQGIGVAGATHATGCQAVRPGGQAGFPRATPHCYG